MTNSRGTKPPFTRRRFLIEPKVQLALPGYFILISLFINTALCITSILYLRTYSGELLAISKIPFLVDMLRHDSVGVIIGFFVANSIVQTIIMIFMGVFVSHRMVGPIYQIRNWARALAAGESPRTLNLRKHDYFKDLAKDLETLRTAAGLAKAADKKSD